MKCRICGNESLKNFLSLGKMPLANSFLSKQELTQDEKSFPLETCFCGNCKLVQLSYVVPAEMMFKNYVYVSSTTNTFKVHFTKMAEDISRNFTLNEDSLAVDIGSNDGILLKGFQRMKVQTIGVEPAVNIAAIAEQNGVETINDFFGEASVNEIIRRKGQADVVTATNVFAHVNDIHDFVANVKSLLKKDGIFVIEVPYLVTMFEKMLFDTIYHEHLSYFSLTSLNHFFGMLGMQVFDVQNVDSHGGSLRVFVEKNDGKFKINPSVTAMLKNEKEFGVDNFALYKQFADKVYNTRHNLVMCLKDLKGKGNAIAAYGAPAKGNTLLNFCQIGTEYISYVVDDNPLKIGLYTPGMHIPVVSSKNLEEQKPDYILILAWNFAKEIMEKTKKLEDGGVKFIIPLPEVVVLPR